MKKAQLDLQQLQFTNPGIALEKTGNIANWAPKQIEQ